MNLLFYLSRYPGWGGIETVTYLIVPELLKLGYNVDIVSHRQEYGAQPEIPDVTLYKMPHDSFYCEGNVAYATQLLTQHHYDAIIYQDCYEPSERIVVEMSQKFDIPLVVFEHNTPLYARKNLCPESWTTLKGIAQRIYYIYLSNRNVSRDKKRKQYLYDNCFKYVMLSKQYIPEIKALLGIKSKETKFSYINNPIIQCPNNSHIDIKQNEILYVGRLVNIKNVIKILAIWRTVCAELFDYKLTIIGDGPERTRLEKYVNEFNLPRVTFEGYQHPNKYYQRAKYLLMTSKFEGWSMTLLEAMSAGCVPLVEYTFSALIDIVDDTENGFILPANCSIRAWHKKLIEVTRDHETFLEISNNAKNKVNKFALSKVSAEWNRLLKMVHESNVTEE
jgi:glycosyltransferase involved in cell wall biosynthesis